MESVIARLLNDFESGRLTRRQLVQTLAMVAVGSPVATALARSAAAAPPTSAAPAAPWKTVWLDHISFQVSDYKKSVEFYTDLMGWTVKSGSDNGRQATLDINGIGGIIIRNGRQGGRGANAAAGAEAAAPPTPPPPAGDSAARGRGGPRPPITGVIDHVSWGIEPWDTEAVRAELQRRDLNPRQDTGGAPDIATSSFKSFHVRDPDGWDLQISNQTREKHQ